MSAERVSRIEPPLKLSGTEVGDGGDGISAWLDVLERLVPRGEAAGIREELESHLRERVRDLEVTGMGEGDAARCAVAELGDAASVARRYREARWFTRRRLTMNMAMFGMAGGALLLGVVSLSQPGERARVSVFSAPEPTTAEQAALTRKFDVSFDDVPIEDAIAHTSKMIGMPINVAWRDLEERGLGRGAGVKMTDRSADFRAVLSALGEQLQETGNKWSLDYRVVDGAMVIATDDYFDRRETVLASYDLSGLDSSVSGEEFGHLIQNFVHPSGWVDNGGDIARQSQVGSKMFVEAPKRYHVQIKWFIDELSGNPHAGGQQEPAAADEALRLKQLLEARSAAPPAAASRPQRMQIVSLQHASAAELAVTLRDAGDWKGRVSIAADPRTNSIILTADDQDMEKVMDLLATLDNNPTRGSAAAEANAAAAERDRLMAELRDVQAQLEEYRKRLVDLAAERTQLPQNPGATPAGK